MARLIEPDKALGHTFTPPASRFGERDLALYALATGAITDPLDDRQLRRVYEGHADGLAPLPGFYAVAALGALLEGMRKGQSTPGLAYGLERVLHAEQSMTFHGPLPRKGELVHEGRVSAIFDKGRHGLVVTTVVSRDRASGFALESEITSLVRSAGGFGGERGEERPDPVPTDREPDAVIEQPTRRDQALLFRLLGDDNPLHADPAAARKFGLKEPILHGMCTLGFAMRHVIDGAGGGDATLLRTMSVRFSDMVLPGETLVTEIWRTGDTDVAFRTRIKERDRIAISHGAARFGVADAPAKNTLGDDVTRALDAAAAHLAARPALARTVGAKFQFVLRDPEVAFVIDLRGDVGVVRAGVEKDADCMLELSARDFLRLGRGEILGKALYLTGALKMTGRTELASHLDFLREVGAATRTTPSNASTFDELLPRLAARITPPANHTGTRLIAMRIEGGGDLTVLLSATPQVVSGHEASPDATITMPADAFAAWVAGTSTLRVLYMRGIARVSGDARAARALDEMTTGAATPTKELST